MARKKGSTNTPKAVKSPDPVVEGILEELKQLEKEKPTVETEITPEVLQQSEEAMNQLVELSQEMDFQEQLNKTIETVRSGTEELTQIAKDLGVLPEQEATIDSNKPTEAVEEESEETNTDVAIEEENALESTVGPINVTHTIVLSSADINKLMAYLLYLAYLGGTPTKGFLPRLSSPPYQVKIDIDNDAHNKYLAASDKPEYDPSKEYDTIAIGSGDPMKFIEKVVEAAKDEVFMIPNKAVRTGMPYKVALHTRQPFKSDANTNLLLNNIKYTRDELHQMKMGDLKILGQRYGVNASSKPRLVELILQSQVK